MKILTFIDYYTPGYRAGGPLRTIVNMVENLGDEFEFLIITRDRDLGLSEPYDGININQWNNVGKAKVFYASPKDFTWWGFKKTLNKTNYDALYLNSFFSPRATIVPLLLRRLGLIPNKPLIIAPRGEFSSGALKIKPIKKKLYITFAKHLQLYNNLIWQASSEYEELDIRNTMGKVAKTILVAPDLLSSRAPSTITDNKTLQKKEINPFLHVVFISRISPMKNLEYLLTILQSIQPTIYLSIYGPLEDGQYWIECKNLIDKFPPNITAKHKGELTPEEVPNAFMEHDVFFFPTRGENFGHVIFEALAVGTCVVLSDQTPWQADKNHAVETIPLENTDQWVATLERWANYSNEELKAQREAALQYAHEYIANSPAVEQNRQLFQSALKK